MPAQTKKSRKFALAIYPPFFAAFPVLATFQANDDSLRLEALLRPLALSELTCLLLWLVLGLILRSVHRSAAVVGVLFTVGFLYEGWQLLVHPHWLALSSFLIGLFALAGWSAWKVREHATLNVLSVLMVLVVSVTIAMTYHDDQRAITDLPKTAQQSRRPDIFYIILDGYGRADALQRCMSFDNSSFIKGLESRGFYVPVLSHSNYCQTELSLASSLNMTYLQGLQPPLDRESGNRSAVDHMVDQSGVVAFFKSIGYRTISITTGFPAFSFQSTDEHLQGHPLTLLETTLIQMTPLRMLGGTSRSFFDQRRTLLSRSFHELNGLAGTTDQPKFVIAHILAPHPPFVFLADGSPRPLEAPFGLWDGSDFKEHWPDQDYREGYTQQVQWLNQQILDTVDKLTADEDQPPVILLQGDHGSKLRLEANSLRDTDVTEVFENLMAYYVPEEVENKLYPAISPVNSFPVVINGLFGLNIKLQPDRCYYSTSRKPYAFADVTERVMAASPANQVSAPHQTAAKADRHHDHALLESPLGAGFGKRKRNRTP